MIDTLNPDVSTAALTSAPGDGPTPDVEARSILKRLLLKQAVRRVVLKDGEAFDRLAEQLGQAMTRSWNDQMRQAIAAAVERLNELGPGRFGKQDVATILGQIEEKIGRRAMEAALRQPVLSFTENIFRAGAAEVALAGGVDIAFGRPDLDAIDLLKKGNLFAVGNSWDNVTRGKVNAILLDYFNEGMTRETLTARFATDFADMGQKTRHYWESVADHFATKGRELGRVTAYERAGIRYVQVRAQLDDATTAICRAMHGRVIEVAKLSAQKNAYLAAVGKENSVAAYDAWTMHDDKADLAQTPTSGLPSATASPPYHFRCRTITVAYFPPGGDDVQQRVQRAVYDREPISQADATEIRRRASEATWPNAKVAQDHFARHGADLKHAELLAYGRAAVDLVNNKSSDMHFAVRRRRDTGLPFLVAIFSEPGLSPKRQRPVTVLTAVDVTNGKIITHHFRNKLGSTRDDVPVRPVKPASILKGIVQWLFR